MQSRHKCKENGRRSNSGGGVGPGPARSKRPPLPSFAPPRRRCNAITSGVGGVARSPPFPQSSVRPIRPSISSDSDGESSERAVARVVGSFRGRERRWKSKVSRSEVKVKAKTGIALNILRGAKTNGRFLPRGTLRPLHSSFSGTMACRTDGRTDCSFVRRPAK